MVMTLPGEPALNGGAWSRNSSAAVIRGFRLRVVLAVGCLALVSGSGVAATFNVNSTTDAVDASNLDGTTR
jgi:hypothetical protein